MKTLYDGTGIGLGQFNNFGGATSYSPFGSLQKTTFKNDGSLGLGIYEGGVEKRRVRVTGPEWNKTYSDFYTGERLGGAMKCGNRTNYTDKNGMFTPYYSFNGPCGFNMYNGATKLWSIH